MHIVLYKYLSSFCIYFIIYLLFLYYKISEEADEIFDIKTPLTTSQFVEWSCAQFAQPVTLKNETESISDMESRAHYEREWR